MIVTFTLMSFNKTKSNPNDQLLIKIIQKRRPQPVRTDRYNLYFIYFPKYRIIRETGRSRGRWRRALPSQKSRQTTSLVSGEVWRLDNYCTETARSRTALPAREHRMFCNKFSHRLYWKDHYHYLVLRTAGRECNSVRVRRVLVIKYLQCSSAIINQSNIFTVKLFTK